MLGCRLTRSERASAWLRMTLSPHVRRVLENYARALDWFALATGNIHAIVICDGGRGPQGFDMQIDRALFEHVSGSQCCARRPKRDIAGSARRTRYPSKWLEVPPVPATRNLASSVGARRQ